ncbi:hypothetical protein C5167_012857 [Papaver somniferum]|uniref:RRM domain-containing protein n=1 Tax=Papaver somniferum TaxID=3469 RepID=A0A4Y7J1T8_PAPSO|nr:uncharacterized protein LOC113356001 [Papaver somniferum]RZC54002.1 hypothetical protein C5167_012857 [Papaver somniferum]
MNNGKNHQQNNGGIPNGNGMINGRLARDLERDRRTMLFTFSMGHPIPEKDLETVLNEFLGSVAVETIMMQDVPRGEQPMYAYIVFRSVNCIDTIFQGNELVMFLINGNHVWSRRYLS